MSYEQEKKEALERGDISERIDMNLLRYMWESSPFYLKESYHTFFRSLSVLKSLSDNDIRLFVKFLHRREFEAGEIIFKAGESGYGLYFIQSGNVKIQTPEGQEIVNLEKGKYFGELALLEEGHHRVATAVATDSTILLGIFKPDLDKMIESYPVLGAKFLKETAMMLASKIGGLQKEFLELKKQLKALEKKS